MRLFGRINREEKIVRGSFTIEAAMIMGIVLFSVTSVLEAGRTVYNRAVMTAGTYEEAITEREKTADGLWGNFAESIFVDWKKTEPVAHIRKMQMLKGE